MIDDDEKTRFSPRNFGIAAKTVVMPLPPRMTGYTHVAQPLPEPSAPQALVPRAPQLPPPQYRTQIAEQDDVILLNQKLKRGPSFDPKATRMVLPPLPQRTSQPTHIHQVATDAPHGGGQTRMARASRPASQMSIAPPLPASYLEPARPPCPTAIAATPSPVPAWRERLQQAGTKRLLVAAAGIMVVLVLLLPLSSSSANSPAEPQQAVSAPVDDPIAEGGDPIRQVESAMQSVTSDPTQPQRAKVPATEPTPAAPASTDTSISEGAAAAMLLSGRRAEALVMYRELAKRQPSPGVDAMIVVLAQKVDTQ